MTNIAINEFVPSAELSNHIQSYWMGDFNIGSLSRLSQQMVPNGYVELIIHLGDNHCSLYKNQTWDKSPSYTLLGLFTQVYEVNFSSHVKAFGIRFKPEGLYRIFGVPASAIHATYEDMEAVAGKSFTAFCHALLDCHTTQQRIEVTEKYLLQHLHKSTVSDSYVAEAARMIRAGNGNIHIDDVHKQVPISPRQLQRKFKEQLGITPKNYLRIARMNAVHNYLLSHQAYDFTEVAYDNGFFDQSHFIREFRQINGNSPVKFVKESDRYIVNPGNN